MLFYVKHLQMGKNMCKKSKPSLETIQNKNSKHIQPSIQQVTGNLDCLLYGFRTK